MMVSSRDKGKRVERAVAKRVGSKRNPADGTSHTDVYTDEYAIEIKARKSLPKLMHTAMQQAIDDAKGKIPIVVMVETKPGQKPIWYVVSRFEDFFPVVPEALANASL